MKFLDRLEQDFEAIFPDEDPPIEGGFEEAFRRVVL